MLNKLRFTNLNKCGLLRREEILWENERHFKKSHRSPDKTLGLLKKRKHLVWLMSMYCEVMAKGRLQSAVMSQNNLVMLGIKQYKEDVQFFSPFQKQYLYSIKKFKIRYTVKKSLTK